VRRIQVRVPATIGSLGAGTHAIGMALSIHAHIALQVRSDSELSVTVDGDETDKISANLDNLALRGAIRVFQELEDAPVGLHVEVHNAIPFGKGFGEKTALVVGGLVAARNLIDNKLTRDELVQMALGFGLPFEGVIAATMGSFSLCTTTPVEPFQLGYASLDIAPMRVIIVAPELSAATIARVSAFRFPQTIDFNDAIRSLRQAMLMGESLRRGDYGLLKRSLAYILHETHYTTHLPWLPKVRQAAIDAGAAGMVLADQGQLLVAFTESEHFAVAEAMETTLTEAGVACRHWVLPIDRQGVVISAIQESETEAEKIIDTLPSAF
jgi:homoserine kinase